MPTLKIVTINIFSDLSLWHERRGLIVQGLKALNPDLVSLQEVSLPENNARWLADQIGLQHVYLCPKTGQASKREAIAILSRLPFYSQGMLDLETQNRVAQYVQVRVADHPVIIANGHFFWQPGDSPERQRQIARLLEWLHTLAMDMPVVVCGDFNSTPESPSIRRMRSEFDSAYAAEHGHEPEFTTPTPLPRSKWILLQTLLRFIKYIRLGDFKLGWQGTLDYIFVNALVQVKDCQLVLNQPAPENPRLYPSDHFGLMAVLDINASSRTPLS